MRSHIMITKEVVDALTFYGPLSIEEIKDKIMLRGHEVNKNQILEAIESLIISRQVKPAYALVQGNNFVFSKGKTI